jgi:hypothetical protein
MSGKRLSEEEKTRRKAERQAKQAEINAQLKPFDDELAAIEAECWAKIDALESGPDDPLGRRTAIIEEKKGKLFAKRAADQDRVTIARSRREMELLGWSAEEIEQRVKEETERLEQKRMENNEWHKKDRLERAARNATRNQPKEDSSEKPPQPAPKQQSRWMSAIASLFH